MKYKSTVYTAFLIVGLLTVGLVLTGCTAGPGSGIQANTFERLGAIRTQKKKAVINRLGHLMQTARQAQNDTVLIKAFQTLGGLGNTPSNNSGIRSTIDNLDLHYVGQYGEFYDLLFIRNDGIIFHSLRMESDFNSNLFNGPLATTKLARALRQTPVPKFVDYDYYTPSAEPASFFITPVESPTQTTGWIAFQLPINIINNIMTDHQGLGITGEAYLTNTDKIMLTQSRLLPQKTILKLPIDTEATATAIDKGKGNLLIDDYRKVRVFSSFEKMDFENVAWVLIVEMDEDEVITDQFRQNPEYFIKKAVAKTSPGNKSPRQSVAMDDEAIRVDINEYAKGKPGQRLWTKGIATCTGVIITYPGQFSYLGHIYPLDDSYFSPVERISLKLGHWLRGVDAQTHSANLLGKMLNHITQFDVTKAKLRDIRIVLVAVHTDSFDKIITSLLERGLFLSQIKILNAQQMTYANVAVNSGQDLVTVEWGTNANDNTFSTSDKEVENFGTLVKSILLDNS